MLQNLCIIFDNKADTATLAVSSQASASLGSANLLTDIKSDVWRSTGTTETITATWSAAQLLGGAALAFTDLSTTATMRVRYYTEVADTVPVFDTGTNLACPAMAYGLWTWGVPPLGVNAFAYGGGAYARAWLDTAVSVKKVVIDLVDTSNPAGYIEVGRLVLGNYWQPAKNADYGASMSLVDTSKNFRSDAGDLMSDVGTRHKKQTLALSNLSADDRAILWSMLMGNGVSRPIFFSLYPNSDDTRLEQSHMMWGKLVTTPAISLPSYRNFANSLEIEEV